MASLVEIDALEVLVIVDNEVDPISSYQHPDLTVSGQLADIALRAPIQGTDRAPAKHEIRLDNVCCGAHGLSLMIVRTSRSHSVAEKVTSFRQPSGETSDILCYSTLPLKSRSGSSMRSDSGQTSAQLSACNYHTGTETIREVC